MQDDGKFSTTNELVTIINWWLQIPEVKSKTIKPLLLWTLAHEENCVQPLSLITASALPYNEKYLTETMAWYLSEALKSEESKQFAKEALVTFFSTLIPEEKNDEHDIKK